LVFYADINMFNSDGDLFNSEIKQALLLVNKPA